MIGWQTFLNKSCDVNELKMNMCIYNINSLSNSQSDYNQGVHKHTTLGHWEASG